MCMPLAMRLPVAGLTLSCACNAEAVEAKRQRKQAVDAELGELHTRCDGRQFVGIWACLSCPVSHL